MPEGSPRSAPGRGLNTLVVRAPRYARASCGALFVHWPFAAKERAPEITAQQAANSTLTNG